jgi:DNA end-binding protein Ku
MLWPDEVRAAELPAEVDEVEPRKQEMAMAASFIDAMSGDWEPQAYTDDYRAALEELVASKIEGRDVVTPPETEGEEAEVVDLMDALRKSVEAAKERKAGTG